MVNSSRPHEIVAMPSERRSREPAQRTGAHGPRQTAAGASSRVAGGPGQHWLVVQRLVDLLARATRRAVALRRREAAQRELSLRDELTGLYNRRGLGMLAGQQLRIGERTGRRMALFFVDVDGLKQVNDTHGHTAGDEVLKRVAAGLRATFRRSDVVARWGGDEFIALAVDTAATNEQAIVTRLERAIRRAPWDAPV